MKKHPNILIFCTDEQRGDHLGCMGHPHIKTPNIDRIAAEGSLFRNCYSSSPVCMPARATMITGLTNRASGVYSNGVPLDKSIPTLPGILAGAGYRTHSVGKIHLQPWGGRTIAENEDTSINPERRIYWKWPGRWEGGIYTEAPDNYYGFQTQDSVGGHVDYAYGDYVTWLEKNHPGVYEEGYRYSNQNPGPLTIDADLHYNKWIADRAIEFVENASGAGCQASESAGRSVRENPDAVSTATPCRRDRTTSEPSPEPGPPFFLWCSFPDPHEPFAAVEKWSDFYEDIEIELPPHTLELSPDNRSETMKMRGKGMKAYDPEWTKECIRQTYGMISHIDEQVGRVLDALENAGIADDTVVMFISDHGDQLGEHGLFYKADYPYNAHMHIPFVASIPGGVEGRVVDDVVSQLDLVPTALDLAGVPHPDDLLRQQKSRDKDAPPLPALPGEVLTPVLRAGARPVRRNALVEHDTVNGRFETVHMRTLVTNDFKLVYYTPLQEVMLFDRKNDPDEIKNLADESEYSVVVNKLLKQLLAELARTEMRAHCRGTSA